MTDYTELIRSLRNCSNNRCTPCDCGWFNKYQVDESCKEIIMWKAAAAIEAMQAQLSKQGEIVRCRECRYRITAHGISDGWVLCSKPYTERGNAMHRADWFCADGEREVQE